MIFLQISMLVTQQDYWYASVLLKIYKGNTWTI